MTDITEQYLRLADQGRFVEALPIIEEIVKRAPQISTSWFNQGVCLAELSRHGDAATSFLEAYALDPDDGGALLRACLALAATNDAGRLLQTFERECERDSGMLELFLEEPAFAPFFAQPAFTALAQRFSDR